LAIANRSFLDGVFATQRRVDRLHDRFRRAAAASQSGGQIAANTGVIDWFQFGGNTYLAEAINATASAAPHSAFAATDELIKIVSFVNLSGENLAGNILTL
jgi:hypothetical protein